MAVRLRATYRGWEESITERGNPRTIEALDECLRDLDWIERYATDRLAAEP